MELRSDPAPCSGSGTADEGAPEATSLNIESAVENLAGLMQSAEQEFLRVGELLQEIAKSSEDTSKKSMVMASQMSGQGLLEVIGKLQSAHVALGRKDAEKSKSEGLDSVLHSFGEIPRLLDSLGRTLRILEITGFLVKVENARFEKAEAGFNTVAEDLQNLGQKIRAKAEDLRTNSSSIAGTVNERLRVITHSEQQHSQCTRLILDRIVSSLTQLREKHHSSASVLQELSREFQSISDRVGEIVESLQAHDITRQRIEHCLDALKSVRMRLNTVSPEDSSTASECADICSLQAAQLNHTGQYLGQAIGTIKESLQQLLKGEKTISMEALGLTQLSSEKEKTFLGNIDEELGALEKDLAEYGRMAQEMTAVVGSVPAIVADMAEFAAAIKRMGIQMKFVAMNASINAARIGEKGVSLGVLAMNTQELAGQTTADIDAITSALDSVMAAAGELSKEAPAAARVELIEELKSTRQSLHAMDDRIGQVFLDIEELYRILRAKVTESFAAFQIPEALIDAIVSLAGSLETWAMQARQGSNQSSAKRPSMKELESAYTMHAERKIHRAHMEGAGSEDLNDSSSSAAGEFGENVELF